MTAKKKTAGAAKSTKPKEVDEPKDEPKEVDLIEACMEELQRMADVLSKYNLAEPGVAIDKAIVHIIDAKNCLDKNQVF